MNKPIRYLLAFVVMIGCGAFVYGVYLACYVSWFNPARHGKYEIPIFLASTVTSIASVLSTNLGAVLGITIIINDSKFSQPKAWNLLSLFTDPNPTNIQTTACYVYILSMLGAAIVWAHRDFENDALRIVYLIPELTKSLLGVIVGVLAISLNTPATGK
jgi:hypothetical protein